MTASVPKQSTPRQGTEMFFHNIVPPKKGNNQRPVRGRKWEWMSASSLMALKQSTPRQGTEMGVDVCLISHGIETINAPSGDGNMRGISFRHCTMKKLLPRQGTETSSHCRILNTKQSTPRQGTRNHCNTVLLQQFYFETIHTPLGDGKDIPAIAFGMFMKHNQRPDRGQKRAVIFE